MSSANIRLVMPSPSGNMLGERIESRNYNHKQRQLSAPQPCMAEPTNHAQANAFKVGFDPNTCKWLQPRKNDMKTSITANISKKLRCTRWRNKTTLSTSLPGRCQQIAIAIVIVRVIAHVPSIVIMVAFAFASVRVVVCCA